MMYATEAIITPSTRCRSKAVIHVSSLCLKSDHMSETEFLDRFVVLLKSRNSWDKGLILTTVTVGVQPIYILLPLMETHKSQESLWMQVIQPNSLLYQIFRS